MNPNDSREESEIASADHPSYAPNLEISGEVNITQITEFFQEKIFNKIKDMAELITNCLNSSHFNNSGVYLPSSNSGDKEQETANEFSPEIVPRITECFQGRISEDINDMVGHIVNVSNISQEGATRDLLIRLEKYKCILRIQQSVANISKVVNKND